MMLLTWSPLWLVSQQAIAHQLEVITCFIWYWSDLFNLSLQTFPDCHIHEYYWTPLTSWKHRDITVDTKCPLAAPRGQIRSYCNTVSLYHYLYYLGTDFHLVSNPADNNGHVYELRQSLTSDTSWICCDVTELLKAQEVIIPQAKQLLLATTHPINKNFNAVAVYYLGRFVVLW